MRTATTAVAALLLLALAALCRAAADGDADSLLAHLLAPQLSEGPRPVSDLKRSAGEARVVGGVPANMGNYPWLATLFTASGSQFCGGSVIAAQYILTAAHCVVQSGSTISASSVTVGIGCASLSSCTPKRAVTSIIVHPSYSSSTFANDIAILKLTSALSSPSVISLASASLSNTFYCPCFPAEVLGYGTLTSGGSSPSVPYIAYTPIVAQSTCSSAYSNILSGMFCAGSSILGSDSCQGDSGGPIFVKVSGTYYQQGIVSFGIGCGLAQYPGVYTRVAYYNTAIQAVIGGSPTMPTTTDSGTLPTTSQCDAQTYRLTACTGSTISSRGVAAAVVLAALLALFAL